MPIAIWPAFSRREATGKDWLGPQANLDVMINSIRGVPGTVKIGGTTSNSLPYIELENKIQGICCGYREKKGGELIVQRPR